MQNLPIGTQSFKIIRTENYVYVDKTKYVFDMIDDGRYYFLSRPRRFGKSLLVDTMHCLFEGKRELFTGLRVEDKRDWSQQFPVVKISFSTGSIYDRETLRNRLFAIVSRHAQQYDVVINEHNPGDQLFELVEKISQQYNQQVVILVDEYDKVLLDNINKEGVRDDIREELKGFYQTIKDLDQYLKFTFLTGITKFSKVSLFSGLNNLEDITLEPKYGEICGMTLQEIQNQIPREYVDGVDYDMMHYRYNGFNFLGQHKVFNPFDVLLYLKHKEFKNYRFETATPGFLIQVLKDNKQFYYLPNLFDLSAGEALLGSFDIDNIDIETLLFQAGYLTIDTVETLGQKKTYHLVVPNYEVKMSLNDYLIEDYLGVQNQSIKSRVMVTTLKALRDGKPEEIVEQLTVLFANISYTNYINNYLATYKGYYSSVVRSFFYGIGVKVIAEDTTNQGRIDMTLQYDDNIYIVEFKVKKHNNMSTQISHNAGENHAINQINQKNYAEKYGNYTVFLVGIIFDMDKKQIADREVQRQ